MFEIGDKVVLNGFRAGGAMYKHGTIPQMLDLEKSKEVLTITAIDDCDKSFKAETNSIYCYVDKSEIRYATDEEIKCDGGTLSEYDIKQKLEKSYLLFELSDGGKAIAYDLDNAGNLWYLHLDDYYYGEVSIIKSIILEMPKQA